MRNKNQLTIRDAEIAELTKYANKRNTAALDAEAQIAQLREQVNELNRRLALNAKMQDNDELLREQVKMLRDAIKDELIGADYGRRAMRTALDATKEIPE